MQSIKIDGKRVKSAKSNSLITLNLSEFPEVDINDKVFKTQDLELIKSIQENLKLKKKIPIDLKIKCRQGEPLKIRIEDGENTVEVCTKATT